MSTIDMRKLRGIASRLSLIGRGMESFTPHDFIGLPYPPKDHSQAINWMYFCCLHQYGFWKSSLWGYKEPLYGQLDSKAYKGSDLLEMLMSRAFDKDATVFDPQRLSTISERDFRKIFSDDTGPVPLLATNARYIRTVRYGRWFTRNGITPTDIVNVSNIAMQPLRAFLAKMGMVSGFNTDSLAKRQNLLAMMLVQRLERFLKPTVGESIPPILDYHVMRIALRMGIVVPSATQRFFLEKRLFMPAPMAWEIRANAYDAVKDLIRVSVQPMPIVDNVLWGARRYCPEMTAPNCQNCPFDDVCAKDVKLFQPVYITTDF